MKMTFAEYATALEGRVDYLKEKIDKDKKICDGLEGFDADPISEFDSNLLQIHE